jgi:hypothetical protein
MPDDHQNERPKRGQWAGQRKKGMEKQRQQAASNTKQDGSQHVDED